MREAISFLLSTQCTTRIGLSFAKNRLNLRVMLFVILDGILTESRLATLECSRLTVNRLALPGGIIRMEINPKS